MNITKDFPKPTYEFLIPSIYDDASLACRVYSVQEHHFAGRTEPHEATPLFPGVKPWIPRGAIVAHPHHSIGGSYDSTVVMEVVRELMKAGFTVGTFNLR